MRESKKRVRDEIKRMRVSFPQINKEPKRKIDPNLCLKCKEDARNNFVFTYKKNNELKGKMCVSCYHKGNQPQLKK